MRWRQFSSREITINALKDKKLDAAVIGGGYSSLTADYGGFSVAVIERRRVGGDAVITEKLDPAPASASFTSILDEEYLLLGELHRTEISKFSFCDAVVYPRFKSQLECFSKLLNPMWDSPTPEISEGASSACYKMKNKLNDSTFWSACLQRAVSLGQKKMEDVMDLLFPPAPKVLNNWFEACGRGNRFCLLNPSCSSTMLQRKLECT